MFQPPAKDLPAILRVLLNYGLLLVVVAAKPAIPKNNARKAQMGNLKADIRFPHPGLTGVGQTLLGPQPPFILTVIYAPFFQVFVRHKVLLFMAHEWKAWGHDILLGAWAFYRSHYHNAGKN